MKKEQRFAAGTVQAEMDVREGCIETVRLSGDFFADGDITALESALRGLPLDEHLAERLPEGMIRGVSAAELARLLTD